MSEETCKTCNALGFTIIENPYSGVEHWKEECPDCKGLGTIAKIKYEPMGAHIIPNDKSDMQFLLERIEKLEKKVNVLDYTKASLDNIKDLLAINMQQQALNASVNNILETLIEKSDAKP
jgi:hypothetical protein